MDVAIDKNTRWPLVRLGDVCEIINGLWKGEKPPLQSVAVIRNANFEKDGSLDYSDVVTIDVEVSKFSKRKLKYGDIILEKSGGGPNQPVGRVVLFEKKEGDYSFSNFTFAIRVNNNVEIHFRYLYHFLRWVYSSGQTIEMQNNSTNIRNLDAEKYRNILIPLPPLAEQQRIVARLDAAFAAIAEASAAAEANLRNARALFDSYLDQVFSTRGAGWVERRLGDVAALNYGYTESATYERIGPQFLRITDIQENRVDWETVPFCRIESNEFRKYQILHNDIVFARTGATTGKSYLVQNPPYAVCASYLIRLRLLESDVSAPFVYLFFQTSDYWSTIGSGVSGSAQGGFNASKLADLLIPFPIDKVIQNNIVELSMQVYQNTLEVENIYKQKITALTELKQSLLAEVFGAA